jgi:hypothetical protein
MKLVGQCVAKQGPMQRTGDRPHTTEKKEEKERGKFPKMKQFLLRTLGRLAANCSLLLHALMNYCQRSK